VTDPVNSYAFALEEARRAFDALAAEATIIRDRAVSVLGWAAWQPLSWAVCPSATGLL